MAKLHTVPNTVTLRTVLCAGSRAVQCAVAWRDREALAYYPVAWIANDGSRRAGCERIPTVSEVQRDARWNVKGE